MSEPLLKPNQSSSILISADITQAELHNVISTQQATRVRDITLAQTSSDQTCKCCSMPADAPLFPLSCNLIALGQLGIGFPLFFYTIKAFITILSFGSLLVGIFCIFENYQHSDDSKGKFSGWISKLSIHENDGSVWQGVILCGFSVFVIGAIAFFRGFIRRKIIEIDAINITPSDFTVLVKGLRLDTDLEDFKGFMERCVKRAGGIAEVVAVCPSYDIREYVKKVKRIKKIKEKINFLTEFEAIHGKPPKNTPCCTKTETLGSLQRQLKDLNDWRESFEKIENLKLEQGHWAFVIYKKQTDAKEIIDHWRQGKLEKFSHFTLGCLHKFIYSSRTYKGSLLKIESAPEPSDIIWENLTVTIWVKLKKRIKTGVITAGLIFVSFVVVLLVKVFQKQQYDSTSGGSATQGERMRLGAISFLFSASIVMLNFIIGRAIRYFSRYEKPSTWTKYHISVFHKLIASTALNTIGLLILVNAIIFPSQDSQPISSDLFNLFLIDGLIIPLILFLNPLYLYTLHLRKKVKQQKIILTQQKANDLWTNPEIDVAQRSARYLRTFLVVMVFSPIFPLGYFLGVFSISIQYWTDKYLLLRRYSRPKTYSKDLTLAVLRWLPVCLLCFSVIITKISNLVVQYVVHDGDVKFIIAPITGVVISAIYFWIPFRKIFGKSIMAEESVSCITDPADDDFYKQIVNFNNDYFRSNPVISHIGWEKWLNSVERKMYIDIKGIEARNKCQDKYQYAILNAGLFGYADSRDSSKELNRNGFLRFSSQYLNIKSMTAFFDKVLGEAMNEKRSHNLLARPPSYKIDFPHLLNYLPQARSEIDYPALGTLNTAAVGYPRAVADDPSIRVQLGEDVAIKTSENLPRNQKESIN